MKTYIFQASIFFTLLFSFSSCSKKVYEINMIHESNSCVATMSKPKNVILMIGDGMGLSQITAGLIINNQQLNLEQFNNIGLHKSFSYDNLVTDSAAGATAFASGVKTYNGAIGVTPDTIAAKTLLEEAQDKGLETGLVVSSTIVHATPAAFIAHNRLRKNYEEIAVDVSNHTADVLIGGGKKFFDRRKDEQDLISKMESNGYEVKTFLDGDIQNLTLDPSKKILYLTADEDPLPVSQGRDYLVPATELALNRLNQSENGFFMMIEGSQIDWGGHANNSDYIVSEMIDFDHVIGKVLDFAKKDRNTLVVVTADHETGGYAILNGTTAEKIEPGFSSTYHSATMIPVFAYGPGSEDFRGIYQNTDINKKIKALMGWE